MAETIKYTPWDAKAFGIDTYELENDNEETLRMANRTAGHYTVKVDPLASKRRLHEYGFYYCDTLLKPYCRIEHFRPFADGRISLSEDVSLNELVDVSSGAYKHGRFHRDFMIPKENADRRYDRWLAQLYRDNKVWALLYDGDLAGFFAFSDNHILLQVLQDSYQGRGLSKYFWTTACERLFHKGFDELTTSISACNLAMVNLVTSLGFKFKDAVDVYHKLNVRDQKPEAGTS